MGACTTLSEKLVTLSPGHVGRLTLTSTPGDGAQETLPRFCDSSVNLRLLQINPKGKCEADRLLSLACEPGRTCGLEGYSGLRFDHSLARAGGRLPP